MMAAVLVLCRLCQPSSELHIAEHLYKHTAIADLLGVPVDKINDDRLYRALDRILEHKDALQIFLKNRLGSLFDLEYDLLLYDVTSTYFEGLANGNPIDARLHEQRNQSFETTGNDHPEHSQPEGIAISLEIDGQP
jgi:hypothetical protein